MPMPNPCLYAEPVQKIELPDASGWLYRWDNGDLQMMWIVPPSQKRLEDLARQQPWLAD